MKEIILLSVGMGIVLTLGAQTFSEWFRQKKTQLKYLRQQIVAFQAYKAMAEKGYEIAKDGLGTIGEVKRQDLDLHAEHFSSLSSVNPAIRNNAKVAAILDLTEKGEVLAERVDSLIREIARPSQELAQRSARFVQSAKDTFSVIRKNLIKLVTDGVYEVTDDERLTAIDDLYKTVQTLYRGLIDLTNSLETSAKPTEP